jgi:hypothetical protein
MHLARLSLTFSLCLGLLTAAGPAHASVCATIADARTSPLGTSVSLVGIVSVPSGAFDSGFAIQQGIAGIYVVDSGDASYAIGDTIHITGELVSASGLLAIKPASITRLRKHHPVRAQSHATGSVSEVTEGQLLSLHGTLVGDPVDDSPYGYKLSIDDGSGPVQLFLYPGSDIGTEGLVDGASVSVICFSNQYDTHYECDPRRAADLTVDSR